jgi:hypothetical protein
LGLAERLADADANTNVPDRSNGDADTAAWCHTHKYAGRCADADTAAWRDADA